MSGCGEDQVVGYEWEYVLGYVWGYVLGYVWGYVLGIVCGHVRSFAWGVVVGTGMGPCVRLPSAFLFSLRAVCLLRHSCWCMCRRPRRSASHPVLLPAI